MPIKRIRGSGISWKLPGDFELERMEEEEK